MMTHLPEPVSEQDIMEMFSFADKDRDGRISYDEFLIMITPVKVRNSRGSELVVQVPEGMVGSTALGIPGPLTNFPPPLFPGLDPAPPPREGSAAPLLEGSVVGGEGNGEGPAASIQGDVARRAASTQGDVAVATLVTTAE
jgi:hypothetical protein